MHQLTLPFKDPVAIFALVLLIVLIAPIVSKKLKIPSIVGLILAGILFGPHVFGVLERDSAIELLAAIGLLYIMFLSGLEIELEQFKRKRNNSIIFGLLTFAIPLVLGTLAGLYLLKLNLEQSVLLASMFSSHTLLTFPVISKLGLSKRDSVVTGVGGTIITDVLAIMILAFIAGEATGSGGYFFWFKLIGFSVLFIIGMFTIVPSIGQWFFKNINSDGFSEYVFIMAVLFISASVSGLAGLEPIIGAFFAGLTLNRLIPEKSILMNRITFVGNSLFIPFFLISVGMLINPILIFQGRDVLIVSLVMVFVALISKFLAAYFSGKILRFKPDDILLLFGMSVNQAAATLAAVLVGYKIGLFNDTIITGTIMMILFTCMVGAWVTAYTAKKIVIDDDANPALVDNQFQRIMIAVSNNKTASELMNFAFLLRTKNSVEPVYPILVVDNSDDIDLQIAKGEKMLAPIVVQAISADIPVTPVTRADGNPSVGIIRAVSDLRISDIIMGWSDKAGFYSSILGGVSERVVKQIRQSVFITKLKSPINVTNRIVLILPALIDKHFGFSAIISRICNLCVQITASIHLIANQKIIASVNDLIKKEKITVQVDVYESDDWKKSIIYLKQIVKKDDLIAFISLRTGEIGWQPALDRLPKKIVSEIPDNNFALIYPETVRNKLQSGNMTDIPEILHAIDYADFNIESADIQKGIWILLSRMYSGSICETLINEMVRVSNEEPVELCDGVILLHAHVSEIKEYRIFFGVNKNGFDIPSFPGKIHAFFMLLAPKEQSPEKHLAILAAVAKLVQAKQFLEKIESAQSLDDFKASFKDGTFFA